MPHAAPASDQAAQAATQALNLYSTLRVGFAPAHEVAIETDTGLLYRWQDLDSASAMMANLLQSLGVTVGARVLVQVDKSVEALLLYLATLRVGAVFVPLNPAYQSSEMAYFIANAEPAVVVCTPANFGWVSQLAFTAGTGHVFTLGDDRQGSLLERARHCSEQHAVVPVADNDLAAILYTSGTTGRSKGAMLTHGNLRSNAQVLHAYWGWQSPPAGRDVLIHVLPIFHVHGLFVAAHGALLSGSKMLWQARFDAAWVMRKLPEATLFMGVPTLYVRLLAQEGLTVQACAHMRLFVSGSAPMLPDTFVRWQARTGHQILERYGMSETNMLTSNPWVADPRHGGLAERRAGSVGFALPGVSLRLRDDQGNLVAQAASTEDADAMGQIGEIEVKGPNVLAGYWRMPEQTRDAFTADGYFKTGDLGQCDAQGYVRIVGRGKDLVISGGFNVYPAEIEACLNDLPGVLESAVIGVPHPEWGEVSVAVLVAQPNAQLNPAQIVAQLQTQLAAFKVPKQCFVLEELPRNTMGKVQKKALRERYAALYVPARKG